MPIRYYSSKVMNVVIWKISYVYIGYFAFYKYEMIVIFIYIMRNWFSLIYIYIYFFSKKKVIKKKKKKKEK